MTLGEFYVICPACAAEIPVTIGGQLVDAALELEPDLTDVWAHAWTHNQGDDQ